MSVKIDDEWKMQQNSTNNIRASRETMNGKYNKIVLINMSVKTDDEWKMQQNCTNNI